MTERRWRGGITWALLALSIALAGWGAGTGLVDDAYIFARFAENLAGGHGLRFNPLGEPIEGFTSFAWLALEAGWNYLGGAVPAFARWAGVGLAALAAWFVIRPARGGFRVAIGALFATSPVVAYWAGTGMDAAAFAAATALVAAAVLRRPFCPWCAGIAVGLAAWVRPEGLFVFVPWILVAVLVAGEPHRRGRDLAIVALVVAAAVAPQFALRRAAFGDWLPNTYYAKTSLPPLERAWHGLKYLWRQIPVLLGWFVLAVACLREAWLRRDRGAVGVLVGSGLWLAYVAAIGGDHFALGRFALPLLVMVAMVAARLTATSGPAAGAGTPRSVELKRPSAAPPPRLRRALTAALVLSLLSYLAPEPRRARGEVELARAWLRVGHWLRDTYPPGTRIATIVAGAIPYGSGFETFDMLGLVTGSVARNGSSFPLAKPGHQRFGTVALLEFAPDLIVYPTSGRFREPAWRDSRRIDLRYAYALWDAVEDQRVEARYEPKAARLPDGTWVELLERR